MIKKLLITAAILFSAECMADDVRNAYDQAFASGRVSLDMQKECQESAKKNDLEPCISARSAYENFQTKSRAFMASVDPKDLFNHVTPKQMDDLTLLNQKIGESMDYVSEYLDVKK